MRESGAAARGNMGEAQTDKVSVVTGPRTGGTTCHSGPRGRHWGGQKTGAQRMLLSQPLWGIYKDVKLD